MPTEVTLPPNAYTLRQYARHNRDSFVAETGDTRQYRYPLDAWLWTVLADMASGQMQIFARVNSPLEPLQEIPADVFKALFWIEGYREFEQNLWLEGTLLLADRTTRLYSVHVVPPPPEEKCRRGPQPTVAARVESEMWQFVQEHGREALAGMKKVTMQAKFDASGDVCLKCRREVLGSEFPPN